MRLKYNIQKLLAIWWIQFTLLAAFYYFLSDFVALNVVNVISTNGFFERFLYNSFFSRFLVIFVITMIFVRLRAESSMSIIGLRIDRIMMKHISYGLIISLFSA
ncbi:hypothetical protein OAQ99_02965, partial [Candidatus Kapabacteria bacterium]|nr:hypothetical protein [Candidatus Kapabacteria bacterium]